MRGGLPYSAVACREDKSCKIWYMQAKTGKVTEATLEIPNYEQIEFREPAFMPLSPQHAEVFLDNIFRNTSLSLRE